MITNKEHIANILHGLHDGEPSLLKEEKDHLLLKADIQYIAERINPAFEHFYLKLHQPLELKFEPWLNNPLDPKEVWSYPFKIFLTGLDVMNANLRDEVIEIEFLQLNNPQLHYSGGKLHLTCAGISVYDQEHNPVDYAQMLNMVSGYWEEFSE